MRHVKRRWRTALSCSLMSGSGSTAVTPTRDRSSKRRRWGFNQLRIPTDVTGGDHPDRGIGQLVPSQQQAPAVGLRLTIGSEHLVQTLLRIGGARRLGMEKQRWLNRNPYLTTDGAGQPSIIQLGGVTGDPNSTLGTPFTGNLPRQVAPPMCQERTLSRLQDGTACITAAAHQTWGAPLLMPMPNEPVWPLSR